MSKTETSKREVSNGEEEGKVKKEDGSRRRRVGKIETKKQAKQSSKAKLTNCSFVQDYESKQIIPAYLQTAYKTTIFRTEHYVCIFNLILWLISNTA